MNTPDQILLTAIELSEIRNHDIKKRICDLEKQKILLLEDAWLNQVSERLQINVRQYHVDIQSGVCTLIKPEPEPELKQDTKATTNG